MANLIDAPEYTENEIYQIAQTDAVEGAAAGASFGGTGVSNHPHQQLANRTAYLYGLVQTLIANVALLLAFIAKFRCSLGVNGYLMIPFVDIALGAQIVVIQWGFQVVAYAPSDINVAVNWPIAFANSCLFAMGTAQGDDFTLGLRSPSTPPFTKTVGNFLMGWTGDNDDSHPTGFYWLSIGY